MTGVVVALGMFALLVTPVLVAWALVAGLVVAVHHVRIWLRTRRARPPCRHRWPGGRHDARMRATTRPLPIDAGAVVPLPRPVRLRNGRVRMTLPHPCPHPSGPRPAARLVEAATRSDELHRDAIRAHLHRIHSREAVRCASPRRLETS